MKTPESYEKDDICKYLDSIGAWYFRPFMAGYGKSGVADIIACLQGMFFSIEVKRPGKAATPRQQTRMDEIERAGGFAVAGDAEQVIAYLKTALMQEAEAGTAQDAAEQHEDDLDRQDRQDRPQDDVDDHGDERDPDHGQQGREHRPDDGEQRDQDDDPDAELFDPAG